MDTSAGLFARLVAQAVSEQMEPVTLLALLKHPLCRLGRAEGAFKSALETLELALLRGTRPRPGSRGLAEDFTRFCAERPALHGSEPRARLDAARLDAARELIGLIQLAFAPLEQFDLRKPHDFSELAARHHDVLRALSADDTGNTWAFENPDGRALAGAFDALFGASAGDTGRATDQPYMPPTTGLKVQLSDYPDVFQTAFGDRVVRRPRNVNARLRIYGLLEARLTQSDRVILGGLVEGVWPPAPRIDPWLSRPMRHGLGLDLPERRIGLTAHDFAQLLGAGDVILSHAAKSGGAPAVASRFLHRLEAVAGRDRWEAAKAAGEKYVRYAGELDRPETVEPVSRPAPTPPRAARPLRLSVTAIEDWLRDPYTIYAKHILKLAPLDPVDMPLSAADRGSAIHDSLADFTKLYPTMLPDDPAGALRKIGEEFFAPLMERPEARALWWPRFLRIAMWFANWEIDRRINVVKIGAEAPGMIVIPLGDGRQFTLTARADRIEHRTDRTYAILDYKTGNPPSNKQVRLGLSPQLTLESAILREGGFEGIPAGASVSELMYVRLSGNTPPGEPRLVTLDRNKNDTQSPDEAADDARNKLEILIREFDDEATAYTSLNLSMWAKRYGTYDDLARIKEWSAAGGAGGSDE